MSKKIITNYSRNSGFTLMELLIVIAIIGILTAVSIFGLAGFNEAKRDALRKSDMKLIMSQLELYRADCGDYPATLPAAGAQLVGDGTPTVCSASNVYISKVPADPLAPTRSYYYSSTGTTYMICSALESGGSGSTTGCGSCGVTCNYQETNP